MIIYNWLFTRYKQTMLLILIVISLSSVLDGQILGGPTHGKTVVCYWLGSTYYNPVRGHARFQLGKIDPTLCTHMVYFNAYFDDDRYIIRSSDAWLDLQKDGGMGNFKGVVSLKRNHPHLKVTIAIGGITEGSVKFSKMASDPLTRTNFVRSVVRFLRRFKFDGIDFYWQYPTLNGGVPSDRENFALVIKELSEAFKPHGFILTAFLGLYESTLETAYDLVSLSQYLDLIHLESWLYHDSADGVVGVNAPLRGLDANDDHAQEYSINYLISHGVPPHKMILGLPLHGRTYLLTDPQTTEIIFGETSTKLDGFQGPFSKLKGYIDYIEICIELTNKTSPWIYHWDEKSSTPYLRDRERIISYDNPRSLAIKIKTAVDKGLGGILAWTIDTDDYLGICSLESHRDAETYVDFTKRLKTLNNDPFLGEALKTLNIPNETPANNESPSYLVSNGKLKLNIPQAKDFMKYKLLHVLNDATALSIQEKRITDEMKRIRKERDTRSGEGSSLSSEIGTNL